MVIRALWWLGRLGLGPALTRGYLGAIARFGPRGMPLVFRGYAPTPSDVFVCTFAKSGTNWAMQIVTQIAHHGAAEFGHVHALVPWPEAPIQSMVAPLSAPVTSPTGLRAVKTHVPAAHVPLAEHARYLVVIRDPKDVFVSSLHFVSGIINGIWAAPPALDDWHARFVEERFPLGSWVEHTAGWWALRDRDNVLVLTFADLHGDLPGAVARVAEWMGVTLTPAALGAVVERSGFAWMKAHEAQFATPIPAIKGPRAVMIRQGKRGGAASLLTAEQLAAIDQVCRDGLRDRGSDLPYETLFGGA
ncbi:MAG: hypothetical protein ACI8PZ_005674 [Myxococcota bacterium]